MQKLLIVLAIPFCLPWGAALLEKLIALKFIWTLSFSTMLIQMACIGCAWGLLWPRWGLMLVLGFLAVGYLAIWLADCMAYYQTEDELITDAEFTAFYFRYHLQEFLLAFTASILLVFRYALVWQKNHVRSALQERRAWQFSLFDLLYFSGVFASAVGLCVLFYNRGLLAIHDVWHIAFIMILFFHLLAPSINWLSLGFCLLVMGGLWLTTNPTLHGYISYKAHLYLSMYLALGTLTVWLYRWAGFRIVPRRELALNSQPSGPL